MNQEQKPSSSTPLDRLIAAWHTASSDLEIRVISPFGVPCGSGVITFPLHLPDFGGPSGMVCTTIDMPFSYAAPAKQAGYYCSSLNAEVYSHYDRTIFIETLIDWQYFGAPEQKPSWYSGIPSGHDSTATPENRDA